MITKKGTQPHKPKRPLVGLVLPGGGARGAYQAGVLKAIAEMLPEGSPNPFPIISGTSAGAINCTVLASEARRFAAGVRQLCDVWSNFSVHDVYKADAWSVARNSLHWMLALVSGGLGRHNPRSLLDNAPLRALLEQHVRFARIGLAIDRGSLRALAVTTSSYSCARSVTFYQSGPGIEPWVRARREGRQVDVGLDHLMASVAVPFVFPPVKVGAEFYGDGAIREATPLSPAIHLGADRLLVIGVRDEQVPEPASASEAPPSFGQIAGYMMDSLFLDGLYSDLERMIRINALLRQVVPGLLIRATGAPLRPIDTHIIAPSRDIREIAARHMHEFPRSMRVLMRGVGARQARGAQLASYLLFESGFCGELIELGYQDAQLCRTELSRFLTGQPVPTLAAPDGLRRQLIRDAAGGSGQEVCAEA